MVLGKLLILFASFPVSADSLTNPRFFEYRGSNFLKELTTISFGWFKTLNEEEKSAHMQALTHALMYAENGQRVEWYKGSASGYSMPIMTWPTGSGYCRRIYTQAIAYNVERNFHKTACYSNASSNWIWVKE